MKQILQNYRTGELIVADVPPPLCSPNRILVKNFASLISAGTERSIIELGQKSLLGKAKERPDLVKRFIEKGKNEGYMKTFKEALSRLDNAIPLGYSSAGKIVEVGNNIHSFSPGDRVACIGNGYASHAEYVTVPENLCCKIPESLTFEEASFGMLGIIALHGIRCAKLNFGEAVAVIGLGLLGLLTAQILKAYGAKVIGFDIDKSKVELASKLGIDHVFTSDDDFRSGVKNYTKSYGADAVIITAATKSDAPVNTAVDISRYGGRIVIIGVADIHPQRNEMWHKEVEIIVSKAGGPGTFDAFYENKNVDYPVGYVRWTENRNLEEFLRLMEEGKVYVKSLISHRPKIEQAESIYKNMLNNEGGPYVGVVLEYPETPQDTIYKIARSKEEGINLKPVTGVLNSRSNNISAGVIGAGLFGKALLLPALKKIPDIQLNTLAASSGANVYHTAKKYGFKRYTTDYKEVLENAEINSVFILTPHSMHAKMVTESLTAGKHVFVEKPLCINEEELQMISDVKNQITDKLLMVGYNRRFSPHSRTAYEYVKNRQNPVIINYRVNAGFVPSDHWVHSEEEGGSRIIGEVCHFVDMMQFLIRSNPVKVYAEMISGNNKTALNSDNVVISLKFGDGSIGNILYTASGDKAFSRELVEIFSENKTIVIKDYRLTEYYCSGKKKTFKTFNQEMGHKEELKSFFDVIKGKSVEIMTPQEIFLSALTVFKINESLHTGNSVKIEIRSI